MSKLSKVSQIVSGRAKTHVVVSPLTQCLKSHLEKYFAFHPTFQKYFVGKSREKHLLVFHCRLELVDFSVRVTFSEAFPEPLLLSPSALWLNSAFYYHLHFLLSYFWPPEYKLLKCPLTHLYMSHSEAQRRVWHIVSTQQISGNLNWVPLAAASVILHDFLPEPSVSCLNSF